MGGGGGGVMVAAGVDVADSPSVFTGGVVTGGMVVRPNRNLFLMRFIGPIDSVDRPDACLLWSVHRSTNGVPVFTKSVDSFMVFLGFLVVTGTSFLYKKEINRS